MLSKFKTLLTLPRRRKSLLVEALVCLIRADLRIRKRPLKAVTDTLGTEQNPSHVTLDKSQLDAALDVGHTIEMIAKNMPWSVLCMPQAVAVKWMLQRRGIPCTLYFGTKGDRRADNSLEAHAWVAIDNRIIIGGAHSKEHTALSAFA